MWTTRLPAFAARLGAAVRYHGSASTTASRSLVQWSPILRLKPQIRAGRLPCNLDSSPTLRMYKSTLSTKASQASTKSIPSLHQSIEEGLLKGSSVNTTVASGATAANASTAGTSPNAAVAAAAAARALEREQKERNRRYQQAAINGLCSFMVVLLAAQSLKSGTDKRKAELHLEAALEVLQETQDKLKLVLDTSVSQAIAQSCLDEMNHSNSSSNGMHSSKRASYWFWSSPSRGSATNTADTSTNNDQDNVFLHRFAAIVQHELQRVVGDTALSATERDQKHMHDLAVVNTTTGTSTSTSTTTANGATVSATTGDATADTIMNEALHDTDGELDTVQQSAAPVAINDSISAKKRVFSM